LFDKFHPANSRKNGHVAREQLPLEECRSFTSDTMCRSAMFSELNADLKTPKQRTADNGVRLNPLPAKNTLLTVIFFSALAAAILYWIFFPPAVPPASESSPAPNAQPAERK
jgi:hypothetical protein